MAVHRMTMPENTVEIVHPLVGTMFTIDVKLDQNGELNVTVFDLFNTEVIFENTFDPREF